MQQLDLYIGFEGYEDVVIVEILTFGLAQFLKYVKVPLISQTQDIYQLFQTENCCRVDLKICFENTFCKCRFVMKLSTARHQLSYDTNIQTA